MVDITDAQSTTTREKDTDPPSFFWRWLVMFALGVPGILAVGATAMGYLGGVPGILAVGATAMGYLGGVPGAVPDAVDIPRPLLAALVMLEPTVLVAVMAAIGVGLAPQLGLRSHVYTRVTRGTPILSALRTEIGLACLVGLGLYVVVTAASAIAQTIVPATAIDTETQLSVIDLLSGLPVRLLYGGIIEELLLRWGLLTLLAWFGWHLLRRVRSGGSDGDRAVSSSSLMWGAIVITSIIFGILHLPRVAQLGPLTAAVIVRTVGLNAVAGIGFGWLYWRRSLEAAMVAHGAFHIALVGVSVATVLFL